MSSRIRRSLLAAILPILLLLSVISATNVAAGFSTDLAVLINVAPTSTTVGSTAVYTITLTNNGPSTVFPGAGQVADTLPAGLTFVSNTTPANWTCAFLTGTLTCDLTSGSMLSGGSAVFTFTATAGAAAVPTVTDTVTASVPNCGGCDPNPANNTASVALAVSAPTAAPTATALPAATAVPVPATGAASAPGSTSSISPFSGGAIIVLIGVLMVGGLALHRRGA